jgi:hypothetical protein
MPSSRPADTPPPPTAEFIELEHRAPAQMDPADLALIHAQQRAIAAEAAFFGYDLDSGSWTYDQAVCPVLPDELMLHYRRQFRDGAESLFTAIVPRGHDRVFVVPIVYRTASFPPALRKALSNPMENGSSLLSVMPIWWAPTLMP